MQHHPAISFSQPRQKKATTHSSYSIVTCKQPSQWAQEYKDMMHPRTGLNKDKYVFMRPVGPVQLDGGTPPPSLSPITTTKSKNMCTHTAIRESYAVIFTNGSSEVHYVSDSVWKCPAITRQFCYFCRQQGRHMTCHMQDLCREVPNVSAILDTSK